jgi:dTDP-L-rhamnose 4-epimerase
MATILITGGAGFIGSHTADALIARGHVVRVLDWLDPQIHGNADVFPTYLHPAVERIRGDVRNLEDVTQALDGVCAVYHFAALTGVGQSMYELRNYAHVNSTGTATVLEAILQRGQPLKRFVLASSRAVYGEGTHLCPRCGIVYPPLRRREDLEQGHFAPLCPSCGADTDSIATAEERPLQPVSVYGWTKKHQEDLCLHAAQTFGLPVVCLRYFNVYGSRQSLKNPYTGIVSIFFNRLMAGQPISLYEHGLPGRDFVHISDVVRANVLALEAEDALGCRLNIGTERRHTVLDLAQALASACGQSPSFLDRGEFRIGDINSCFANIERARRVLGYQPQVTLEEGMREFVAWARQQESIDLYERTVRELSGHGLFGQKQRASS